MASIFGLQFDLIEPMSDSPYKKWLEEHGPGIHHIACLTKSGYKDLLENYKKITVKEPWVRGECEAIGMDFSYLDLTKELGMFVEIYGEQSSNKKGHDF